MGTTMHYVKNHGVASRLMEFEINVPQPHSRASKYNVCVCVCVCVCVSVCMRYMYRHMVEHTIIKVMQKSC